MSRNVNSPFAFNPTNIDIQRSRFDRSHDLKTSFNAGDVVPIFIDEVLPGDTFDIRTSKVVRLSTLVTPIMDNIFLDVYFFFVPARLVWSHWTNMNGENDNSPWVDTTVYSVPQITAPTNGWSVGTLADYFGVPTGVDGFSINALPFRAYAKIINDWFRDENLMTPASNSLSDTTVAGVNSGGMNNLYKGGLPFVAAKYHDYFTSALPYPQKGPDINIGVGASDLPVSTRTNNVDLSAFKAPLKWTDTTGANLATAGNYNVHAIYSDSDKSYSSKGGEYSVATAFDTIYPRNLYADASGIPMTSINQLRLAFQVQKMYEKDARGGTRYIESILSHFGVQSPDARLQRSEYLGGNRVPIVISQVVQSSETNTTPQGNTTAYSLTVDSNNDFVKSFTEHGYIIGLCVARYKHSYQQGLNRLWSRKLRTDFYLPVFANIGEQAILNKEIFLQNDNVVDSDGNIVNENVFGYQEAWAEYRYHPNMITGQMRSTYAISLDFWHLGDDYSTLPTLSGTWIREDKGNIDRVLAVSSSISHQFIADFHFNCKVTRPMPLYSIPGLIDHH